MTEDGMELVFRGSALNESETSIDEPETPIAGTFVFLPPGKEHEARRQVRSRAAQYSHRVGPRKPKASKKPKKGTKASVIRTQLRIRDGIDSTQDSSSSLPQNSQTTIPVRLPTAPPSPTKSHIGGRSDNPFGTYPVPQQPWFPRILNEMWDFMLRGWSALPIEQAERDHALVWVQRLTMSNPSYFYMNLLSVAEDLVSKGSLDSRLPLWLTSQVVRTINEALGDAQKALTVGNILAVGRIAVHEIVLGDLRTGQNVHRPAYARMIKMAGGLNSLGLPALVRAHLGWADRLMVHKTGIHISELEPELVHEPTFIHAPQNFQTDVRVLRGYMPKRQPGSDGL